MCVLASRCKESARPSNVTLRRRKTDVTYVDGGIEVVLHNWRDESLAHRELNHSWTGRTIFEVQRVQIPSRPIELGNHSTAPARVDEEGERQHLRR